MTARIGATSIDGTPISEADLARIEAEFELHAEQKRSAVKVVAASALSADDARMLLSMLGLDHESVVAARANLRPAAKTAAKPARKRRVAA